MNIQEQNDFRHSLEEGITSLMENMSPLSYHDYHFDDYLKKEVFVTFEDVMSEDEFNTYYDEVIEAIFLQNKLIKRSYVLSDQRFDGVRDYETQIQYLKDVPQPAQKTPEWYTFRKKHLTGSNIWKLFSTPGARNQLIYEKLAPSSSNAYRNNLSEGPLNWGHKYEPLSILFYEYYNDVCVEEFGCVPHKEISFLAASPDGIVTSKKNNGRMVEIKNVVSREITKIPKMEYYIQMQLQMEVCELPDCDFVETKFLEYENESAFYKDKYIITKGMMMVLVKNNESYIYEYAPLFQNQESKLNAFMESVYEKYSLSSPTLEHDGIRWFKNVYWKLDIYSCVYVPRNPLWFKEAQPIMKETWDLICQEQEIIDSHTKYKPKSNKPKTPKEPNTPPIQVIHL